MSASYDPVKYKISSMQNWNLVAQDYHDGWAGKGRGPFKSTSELVKAANIKPSDFVLDVGCGTGAVSMEASRRLSSGMLVGIDFSRGALDIAKSAAPSAGFIEMDAENIGLRIKFDKVLCQYALMFFPDPARVLVQLRSLMKNSSVLAVAVHGTPEGVPYFSTIMEPVLRHLPDIRPAGAPTVHRFGNPVDLQGELSGAGFSSVSIKEFDFEYQAGTFEEYWSDYLSTTAISICSRIEGSGMLQAIKAEARERAGRYEKGGAINFPWRVLIATARVAQD